MNSHPLLKSTSRRGRQCVLYFAAVLCACGPGCGQRAPLPPGVYASPAFRNLGIVADQKEVSAEYQIANTSTTSVRLLSSFQSCGCTKLTLSSNSLPPGGTVTATLTVNLDGQFGHKDFEARIQTDSVTSPVVRLGMSGDFTFTNLDGVVEFDLGRVPANGLVSGVAAIFKGSATSAKPAGCEPKSIGLIDFAVEESESPGFFRVTAKGTAPSAPGPFQLPVDIQAEGGSWGKRRIVFRGMVVPRWAGPEVVSMGFLEHGQAVESKVNLRDSCPGPPHPALLRAEASSNADWLVADAKVAPDGHVVVSMSAAHPGRTEPVEATVTVNLHTEDGETATCTIIVSGRGI